MKRTVTLFLALSFVALDFANLAAQAQPTRHAAERIAHARLATAGAGPMLRLTIPLDARLGAIRSLDRRAHYELGAVVATGALQITFGAVDLQHVFIPAAVVGWGGYLGYRAATDPGYLREAGFRREGLWPTFRKATVWGGVTLGVMAGIGLAQDALVLHRDMLPLAALYPVYGLLQQFLVQSLITGNLQSAFPADRHNRTVLPITTLAFGAVHLPNLELTAGTVPLGYWTTRLYLQHGNLWPLGVYHGLLAIPYYFWVLERNPWLYVVGGDVGLGLDGGG
jgi:hypothetical protein